MISFDKSLQSARQQWDELHSDHPIQSWEGLERDYQLSFTEENGWQILPIQGFQSLLRAVDLHSSDLSYLSFLAKEWKLRPASIDIDLKKKLLALWDRIYPQQLSPLDTLTPLDEILNNLIPLHPQLNIDSRIAVVIAAKNLPFQAVDEKTDLLLEGIKSKSHFFALIFRRSDYIERKYIYEMSEQLHLSKFEELGASIKGVFYGALTLNEALQVDHIVVHPQRKDGNAYQVMIFGEVTPIVQQQVMDLDVCEPKFVPEEYFLRDRASVLKGNFIYREKVIGYLRATSDKNYKGYLEQFDKLRTTIFPEDLLCLPFFESVPEALVEEILQYT